MKDLAGQIGVTLSLILLLAVFLRLSDRRSNLCVRMMIAAGGILTADFFMAATTWWLVGWWTYAVLLASLMLFIIAIIYWVTWRQNGQDKGQIWQHLALATMACLCLFGAQLAYTLSLR